MNDNEIIIVFSYVDFEVSPKSIYLSIKIQCVIVYIHL